MKATAFAAEKHSSQRRKNKTQNPYIEHPIRVANLVAIETDNVIALSAALLHDTIEDTDTTAEEIYENFGGDVMNLVLAVSDDKRLPKAERKRLQVEHAKTAPTLAKLIKMADALDNMRGLVGKEKPEGWSEKRIQGYLVWKQEVWKNCHVPKSGLYVLLGAFFDKHITVPKEEQAEFLEEYYAEMEKVDD